MQGTPAALLVLALALAGPVVGALAVLAWARYTRTPLGTLGLRAPDRWVPTILAAVATGIILKLLLKAVVFPLLGAPPTNAAYQFVVGNPAALPGLLFAILVRAAIAEEVVYRGFLHDRLMHWVGARPNGAVAVIVLGSLLFGAAHLADQGVYGALQATIVGVVLAASRVRTGSLAFAMAAHAAFDLTALLLIYRGWEAAVARAIVG